MAGPFASIQQQGISEQRLVQTTLPVSAQEAGAGIAKAIGQGGKALADLNTERVTKDKQEALNEQLANVRKGLEVFRFGDEAEINALEKAAAGGDQQSARILEEFNAIDAARQSKRLPGQAATIRARALLKEAISAAPEFEDELRAAARKSLGISLESQAFKSLLREPSAGQKTKAQQELEQYNADVQAVMRNFDRDRETAEAMVQQRGRMEFNAALAQKSLTVGQANSAKVQEYVNTKGSALIADTVGMIAEQTKANGGVFDTATANLTVRTWMSRLRAEALTGVTDPKMTGEISQNMGALENTLLKLVEEASVGNRQQKLFDAGVSSMRANTFFKYPDMRAWLALPNTDGLLQAMELSAKFANNPEIGEKLGITTPLDQMAQLGADLIMPTLIRMKQGQPARDANEVRVRSSYNREVLKSQDTKVETKVESLQKIIEDAGEFSAITALDDGAIIAQVAASPDLTRQARNLFQSKLGQQDQLLRETIDRFPEGIVTLTDGRLSIDASNISGAQDIKLLGDIVRGYNRMVGVQHKYAAVGVVDKWTISPVTQGVSQGGTVPAPVPQESPTRFRWNPSTKALEELE